MPQRPNNFTINRNHPLAQGAVLLGLGALPGSTRYHDSSAFGRTGTLTNMTPSTDWVPSSELQRNIVNFGGTNQYVGFTNAPIFPGLTKWSVSMWLRTDTTAATNAWFFSESKVTTGTEINGVVFRRNGSGLYIHSSTGGASASYYIASGFFTAGALIHLTVACPGSSAMSVYKNGVLASGFTSSGIYSAPTQTSNGITLGRGSVDAFTYEGYWDGVIGDTVIHNRIISTPEIQQLADPSNVMLSGLILPPQRKWWPVVAAGGATSLSVGDAAIVVTSDAPTLVQHQVLAVGDSACLVTSDTPSLTQHQVLTVSDSVCVVASDEPTLTHHPVGSLEVQDSACVVTSDSPTLTQHHVLSVGDAACVVTSDEPTLTAHSGASLVPADSACVVTSDLVVLTQHHLLAVLDSKIVVTSDMVTLGGVGYQPVVYYRPLEGPSKQLRILEGPSKQIKILRRE